MTEQRYRAGVLRRLEEGRETHPTMGEFGLSQFAPYLINRIIARWNLNLADAFKEENATTVNMRVLTVLSVWPGLTVNELSVFAVTEQSTMSRTLDAMEDQGLIRRQQVAEDMRVKKVFLTDSGRDTFERLWPVMYDRFALLFDGVGDDEYQRFVGTLHKLLDNIRTHNI
ncbi:MAG: transcriptional regulator [Tardiphaga sp.]|nr:transcriptional regulator [Tardiphaga sp.]